MLSTTTSAGTNIDRLPGSGDEITVKSWTIHSKTSHILGSKCGNPNGACDSNSESIQDKCQFCIFNQQLSLPHLPDMVFANNKLVLSHASGANIEFIALDALRGVSADKMDLVVSCSREWKDARRGNKLLEEGVKHPFDWTFTTQYSGTILGTPMALEETEQRIDLDKLKRKERILFYKDITLYEDELHDNGISVCNVKMRVMPGCFYVLLRFFLRVDGVLVRINDTRLYHEFDTSYVLREFTSREARLDEINIPSALCTDPNQIMHLLPLVSSRFEKLILPVLEDAAPDASK